MTMEKIDTFEIEAINQLAPNANYRTYGGEIMWDSPDIKQPSEDDIVAKAKELETAYNDQAYARNRQREYPDWGIQLNKIYDDGVDKWKTEMVDPVKAKWPKDNSGPK